MLSVFSLLIRTLNFRIYLLGSFLILGGCLDSQNNLPSENMHGKNVAFAWSELPPQPLTLSISASAGLTTLAAGSSHTSAVNQDGTVVDWGSNSVDDYGYLETLSDIRAVTAGISYSLYLSQSGAVLSSRPQSKPVPAGLSNIKAIDAGNPHNLALTNDGTVIAWADSHLMATAPVQVPQDLTEVVAISAGDAYSLALRQDGTVVSWGESVVEYVGKDDPGYYDPSLLPPDLEDIVAIAAGRHRSIALKSDGRVIIWGWADMINLDEIASLTREFGAIAVGMSSNQAFVLLANGRLVSLGENFDAQYHTENKNFENIRRFEVGPWHGVAVKEDGSIISWGNNNALQAILPADLASVATITPKMDLVLRQDQTVLQRNNFKAFFPEEMQGITAIFSNVSSDVQGHQIALRDDGHAYVVGSNHIGGGVYEPFTLALDDILTVATDQNRSLAVRRDGSLVGWLWGPDGVTFNYPIPADLGDAVDIVDVAIGAAHSAVLTEDGQVKAWGMNTQGQLDVPEGLDNVVKIVASSWATLALKIDGTVVGWGSNENHLLDIPEGLSNVAALAVSPRFAVALQENGSLALWGSPPILPDGLPPISKIFAHSRSLRIITEDGTLLSYGDQVIPARFYDMDIALDAL